MSSGRHGGRVDPRPSRAPLERLPRMSPEIKQIVLTAGRGINPLGVGSNLTSSFPGNPYLTAVPGAAVVPLAVLLALRMDAGPLVGALVVFAGIMFAAMLAAPALRRTPAWHRARRDVRTSLESNPGTYPPELRWYR
jgi:hypothetical protein